MIQRKRLYRPIKRNLRVLPVLFFFIYLLPYAPISLVIFENLTGSYITGMSIFTVMSFATALLEVPMGVLSDKWGRCKTLTIGCFLSFINVAFIALAYNDRSHALWLLYGAAVSQGAAEALYSGNNEALAYETLGQLKKTHQFAKFFGRLNVMKQAGLACSGLLSGLILLLDWGHAGLIYGLLFTSLILVSITLFLVEPPEQLVKDAHPLRVVVAAFKQLHRNKKLRDYSIVNMLQIGAMNASYYFSSAFVADLWPLWAAPLYRTMQHSIGSISFWFSGLVIKRFGSIHTLIVSPFIGNLFMMTASWMANVASPFLYVISQFTFSAWFTAKATFEQEQFSKEQRATMGSLISLGGNITNGLLCLLLGWMADNLTLATTLFVFFLARILFINSGYALIYRRYR